MKLTTHLYLVPRLRMHGAIPPHLHMPSLPGAQLSTGPTLYITRRMPPAMLMSNQCSNKM